MNGPALLCGEILPDAGIEHLGLAFLKQSVAHQEPYPPIARRFRALHAIQFLQCRTRVSGILAQYVLCSGNGCDPVTAGKSMSRFNPCLEIGQAPRTLYQAEDVGVDCIDFFPDRV
jgi:hypothetical protein